MPDPKLPSGAADTSTPAREGAARMSDMAWPTERMPLPWFELCQRIHDTHWELHDIGYSLGRGLADADDVTYSAAMLRSLADALDRHARGMT